jgi:type III secretion protein J
VQRSIRMAFSLAVLAMTVLLTGCLKQELQTGLSELEAQEIIVLLKRHGLDATRELVVKGKELPAWTVAVRGGNQNLVLAWRILRENGLPRPRVKGLEEVFAASGGLIPTASEEKAKLLIALTGEITRTLQSVDGVVEARVHVVLPENSPLLDRKQWSPTTASVLVKHRGTQIPISDGDIKSIVSKGVEGLTPEQVAVVFKSVPEAKNPERDVTWYLGNQELTLGAVSLMVVLAGLLLTYAARVRKLQRQIAAMRSDFAAQRGQDTTAALTKA